MLNDVPIIPITEDVGLVPVQHRQVQGLGHHRANPYRACLPRYSYSPTWGQVLLHLERRSRGSAAREAARPAHEVPPAPFGFFVVTLWAAMTINFFLPRLMPGNPALAMMAEFHGRLTGAGLARPGDRLRGQHQAEPARRSTSHYLRQHLHRELRHLAISSTRSRSATRRAAGPPLDAGAGRGDHDPGLRSRHRAGHRHRLAARQASGRPAAAGVRDHLGHPVLLGGADVHPDLRGQADSWLPYGVRLRPDGHARLQRRVHRQRAASTPCCRP